jgi:hypothetical protein
MNSKVRITRDYGMKDYYEYLLKTTDIKISNVKFNKVIGEINKEIVNSIINDSLNFKIPKLQAFISIRKIKKVPKIVDNKLINTTPVDWKATNKLWDENPEAKEKKILLRYLNSHTFKYVFRIKLIKGAVTFKNKQYYKYKPARSFQRLLAKRILDPNQDNFEAYKLF